jgi:TPR repeat protein
MRFILSLSLALFLLPALAQAQWKEPRADQLQEDMARYGWASAGVYHSKVPAHAGEGKSSCPFGGAFYTKLAGTPEQIAATMRPKAEHGDAAAQETLGMMYETGSGVAENWAEAAKWLRKAADQSKEGAYGTLGDIYVQGGCGVAQDYAEAYFWFSLADHFEKTFAEQHHMSNGSFMTYDHEERSNAEAHLSSQQKADVEKRVADWLKDHNPAATKP